MTHLSAIKLIASYALIYWSTASFANENQAAKHPGSSMSDDMRFTPAHLEVKQGETVRLVVKNAGKQLHELVIGSPAALAEHAAQMLKFPSMEHDEPYMAHVSAGKTGQLLWNFNRAGDFEFACLIPGHYQAGMKGSIRVIATQNKNTPK